MRTAILACFTILSIAACSPQPAKQEPPPAGSAAAGAPTAPQGLSVRLTTPSQLTVPAGSPIHVEASAGGLTLRGHVGNPTPQGRTGGASMGVGEANEAAFAGHRIHVVIRATGLEGATEFTSVYSTNGSGNSGWRHLHVTSSPQDVAFDFIVPPMTSAGDDFLGFDPPEHGAVEIQEVSITVVDAGLRQ